MTSSSCTRFPRFTKAKINLDLLNESVDLAQFGGPFTEEELADFIMAFGETDDLLAGGWVLPDGAILDFNRQDRTNHALRHSRIYSAFSDERKSILEKRFDHEKLLYSDDSIVIDICLAAGFLRYQLSESKDELIFYMSLEKRPTPKQLEFLHAIEDFVGDSVASGFVGIFECNGRHVSYSSSKEMSRRLANDVLEQF